MEKGKKILIWLQVQKCEKSQNVNDELYWLMNSP